MIYTLGKKTVYDAAIALGERYKIAGALVWQTASDAKDALRPDYGVYRVDADWVTGTHMIPSDPSGKCRALKRRGRLYVLPNEKSVTVTLAPLT